VRPFAKDSRALASAGTEGAEALRKEHAELTGTKMVNANQAELKRRIDIHTKITAIQKTMRACGTTDISVEGSRLLKVHVTEKLTQALSDEQKSLGLAQIPTATERIDPPLVDILVTDGKRDARGINEAEAQIIIQEIKTIIDDPALEHRSIGIISLIGDKQAKRIYDLLLKEITPEQFARHRMMCGNAATFQGQERDIMFLSMVECPETSTTKTSRVFEQRFNVAMSRARDRLYLVRSVAPENLKANDLKFKTIEHFRNPMEAGHIAMSDQVLDLCESGLEKEVGGELLKRGYRLRAQVPVAGYRLDFVVEGQGDHRLAIECDGDPYHGPDRWTEDVRRQKALEQLGWIFWRVWGSHWYSDRNGCVQDLITTLDRLNIAPLGADVTTFEWTEHRMVSSQSRSTAAGLEEEEETNGTGPSEKTKASPFENAEALSLARAERESLDKFANGGAKVGDFVVVRYNGTNKLRRIFLGDIENKPEAGIVHVTQPLGAASGQT
jgi:very-short-patch-repair endonuclease